MPARALAVPTPTGRLRVLLAGAIAVALLLTGVGQSPAGADDVSLAAYFNNVGITQDPASGANFDGHGWSYSSIALLAEGVRGGETVTADGMSFTWPDTDSGEPDNMAFNGQVVPILVPAGAERIGLLGAATNGPVSTTVTLHYNYVDEAGDLQQAAVEQPVTFSDWTLNAGNASPHPTNTTAVEMLFRWPLNQGTSQDEPHVFVTSVPIDTTKTLDSIEFPVESRMHLFGMTIQ